MGNLLNAMYPAVPAEDGEKTFVSLEEMTQEDVDFNVTRLRAESDQLRRHAAALEAYGLDQYRHYCYDPGLYRELARLVLIHTYGCNRDEVTDKDVDFELAFVTQFDPRSAEDLLAQLRRVDAQALAWHARAKPILVHNRSD